MHYFMVQRRKSVGVLVDRLHTMQDLCLQITSMVIEESEAMLMLKYGMITQYEAAS